VEIIEWSHQHVTSTLFLCWAVQAALKALYGMEKQTHGEKLSGVYRHHRLDEHEALLRGFDDEFVAPHSRYAAFDGDLIRAHTDLQIFAESEEAGVYLAATKDCRQVFVTGHPEYDALTLDGEYRRDLAAGLTPVIPVNYYPNNDPSQTPRATWRSHGHLLFSNWLNYYVYQLTSYKVEDIGKVFTYQQPKG
ncbi:homoserine O-succinyltransferase, partial [Aeromonas sp. CPF2-S1]|nr:homoserine O-succinyltransferase [Aeromonas sp. CPF2-S1]